MRQESYLNHNRLGAAITDLGDDNRSGAAELLRRAAGIFARLRAEQATLAEPAGAQQAILETAVALVRAQPDMAPLARLAHSAFEAASHAAHAHEALRMAEQAAREFTDGAMHWAEQTATHAAELIGDRVTVLTHSRSSTVLAALRQAHRAGRRFRVIATESRPLLEGRAMAEALADESIEVTFIADAAVALVMPQVDWVFVGADGMTPTWLVNKIGTRMIALAAREGGVKVVALCDTSKFIAAGSAPSATHRRPGELWPDAPAAVEIVNPYFEPTPLDHFTGIVTEAGWLAPGEASRRALNQAISPRLLAALGNP